MSTLIWAAPRLQSEVAELKIVSNACRLPYLLLRPFSRQGGHVLLQSSLGGPWLSQELPLVPLCPSWALLFRLPCCCFASVSFLYQVADQLCAKYSKEYGKLCRSNQIGTVNDRVSPGPVV